MCSALTKSARRTRAMTIIAMDVTLTHSKSFPPHSMSRMKSSRSTDSRAMPATSMCFSLLSTGDGNFLMVNMNAIAARGTLM